MSKVNAILAGGTIFVLSCAALGILAYIPERQISQSLSGVFSIFALTTLIVIVTGGVIITMVLIGGLAWAVWVGYSTGMVWQSVARARQAEALKQEREASLQITVAPAGSQIILSEVIGGLHLRHYPAHLISAALNGDYNPSDLDRATWGFFQTHQSINRSPKVINSSASTPQIEAPLSPILPVLVEAQRVILAGGSNSGKTTLTKHLIAARSDHSKIIVIDPHSPSKIMGFNVIGAGRKYRAIEQALESLVLLMQERYEDVARGVFGYLEHPRISVFIDEWTSIAEEVDHAGRILKTLLTESRKVNIHLVLLTHSTTVPVLGLPDAQIKKSAMVVELTGGNGEPHRAFVQPGSRTTPDGKRATSVEYALPGPFTGFPKPAGDVMLELPDPRIIRVRQMRGEGKSPTAMAREYFGVEKPNDRHIKAINEILEQIDNATEAPEE